MIKLVGKFASLCVIVIALSFIKTDSSFASSDCALCILEIGTASDLGEEYDFVTIGNSTNSSISLSSVQLQYFNSLGVYDSKINLSGTLMAGQTKVFVSEEIKKYNPSFSSLTMSLFSGGGSLKLVKVLTASTTIYDTVGWGLATIFEGESMPLGNSNIFSRNKNISDEIIDSGNNLKDFESTINTCDGITINEIQPFATNALGEAVESWIEVLIIKESQSECSFATSEGKYFTFSTDSLGEVGDVVTINSVIKNSVQQYLELPNPSGSISIALRSKFNSSQPVYVPVYDLDYANLEKSQTYALIYEYGFKNWKKTFQQTPGEQNIFLESPPVIFTGDPNACSNILLNEFIPNPVGSDTGSEWIEIKNISSEVQQLEQCVIEIDSEKYYFLTGSLIGPEAIERFYNLYNEDGDEKQVYLRNTDEAYVSLSRIYGEENTVLQSLVYSDAPEAMSYSRFDDGWAWTYALTPNDVNIYQNTKPTPVATESRASFASSNSPSTTPVIKATSTSKKSSTTNKSLASTAKVTTGAKSTTERDVYQEPESLPSSNSNYVFVVLGALAILYAIYEYKTDIQNFFYKRRRNKALGQEDRQAS